MKFVPKQQVSAFVSHSFVAVVPSIGSPKLGCTVAIFLLVCSAPTDTLLCVFCLFRACSLRPPMMVPDVVVI